MNILNLFERMLIGPEPDEGNEALLDFPQGGELTRRAFTEGLLTIASIGRGKTTMLKTPVRAMLRDGFGGLIPVVKGSLVADMVACVRAEQREADLILFGPGHGHVFNPFDDILQPVEAAALLVELSEALAPRPHNGGGTNEQFWREQLEIILRHLFTLCSVCNRMDFVFANELFAGRASTVAQLNDPLWQKNSPLFHALGKASSSAWGDAYDAVTYFTKTYPTYGERLQGSLVATVDVVFNHLCREPLRDLFSGKSTFSINHHLMSDGKICIVDMPVLDSKSGRVANALLQFCFCREAVRRPRSDYSFLILDECQELVTTELMAKMAVLREFKVAVLLLTQNLSVLDERLGKTAREGLCGLMSTKIFGPQNHAETCQWAVEQFGKRKFETKSSTHSRGSKHHGTSRSETTSEHWDYRVPPNVFAGLEIGETIVLRDDRIWRARWHPTDPGKRGTVAIV